MRSGGVDGFDGDGLRGRALVGAWDGAGIPGLFNGGDLVMLSQRGILKTLLVLTTPLLAVSVLAFGKENPLCLNGKPTPIEIKMSQATFDMAWEFSGKNELVLNAGGLAILTLPGKEDVEDYRKGEKPQTFDMKEKDTEGERLSHAVPITIKIKLVQGKWCLNRTVYRSTPVDHCKPMDDGEVVRLRDKKGLVEGVITVDQSSPLNPKPLRIQQLKAFDPDGTGKLGFQPNGYEIDPEKPGIEIRVENGATIASVGTHQDRTDKLTIYGDSDEISLMTGDTSKMDLAKDSPRIAGCTNLAAKPATAPPSSAPAQSSGTSH
jgi:hypothetical protein